MPALSLCTCNFMGHPFFEPTPQDGAPPLDRIEASHFREAFERGFAEQNSAVARILNSWEPPTFLNTILALEKSGSLLKRVHAAFRKLCAANTGAEFQALEREFSPRYARHCSAIYANPALFRRTRLIREGVEALDDERRKLLDETCAQFVRARAENRKPGAGS